MTRAVGPAVLRVIDVADDLEFADRVDAGRGDQAAPVARDHRNPVDQDAHRLVPAAVGREAILILIVDRAGDAGAGGHGPGLSVEQREGNARHDRQLPDFTLLDRDRLVGRLRVEHLGVGGDLNRFRRHPGDHRHVGLQGLIGQQLDAGSEILPEARLRDLERVGRRLQLSEGEAPFVVRFDLARFTGRGVGQSDRRPGKHRARRVGHRAGDVAGKGLRPQTAGPGQGQPDRH